jgi:hypothetical protein
MNKHKIYFSSALLFLAVGLAIRADALSVAVALNSSGGSVHDVLLVSDRVLGPYGFVRGQLSSRDAEMPERITIYTRHNSSGNPTACNVFLSNKRVVFSFVETANPHSNSITVQLSNQLAAALIQRYNPASVEVLLQQ